MYLPGGKPPRPPLLLLVARLAYEDINVARGNIIFCGVGGIEKGTAPPRPPSPEMSPHGTSYPVAARSATWGARPGAGWVVAAASRAKATPPPV